MSHTTATARTPSPSWDPTGWPREVTWYHRGIAGAILTVVVGWCLLVLTDMPVGYWLKALSYDLPFALRPELAVNEVVIASIDEDSYRAFHLNPTNLWDRELHIDLLKRAFELGARAVVFDLLFDPAWPDPEVDRRFAEAIRKAPGPVVLSALLEESLEGNTVIFTLIKASSPLDTAAPWGIVNIPMEKDQRLRRHSANPDYAGLAWKTAEVTGVVPNDRVRARWINYYGRRGAIPRESYYRVLEKTNALPPNYFAGKVVFVGFNPIMGPQGTDQKDEHQTPYTRWIGETSTGVEIQATAFLNLWKEEWLTELSHNAQLWLVILGGAVFGFGLGAIRPWLGACWAIIGFLVVALAASWASWNWFVWFPWLIIGAAQIPCALGWSLIANTMYLQREKRRLESLTGGAPDPAGRAPAEFPLEPEGRRLPSIPDHTLLRCVGRGGYGEVWLARDVIGTFHAVKVIYRNAFADGEPFEREFRGIQNFTPICREHPGWVDILHVGRHDAQGYFYYIMELGDDETTGQQIHPESYTPKTLASELRRRHRLPVTECLPLGLALAEALDHLHQHSLIHRDIKPSNVIYVKGAPKFTDIGLVTDVRPGRDISWVGTEGYLAPEGPVTPATDVYALGKLLYVVATGLDVRAFPELPTGLLEHPASHPWHRFYDILLKACESMSVNRYPSAIALRADLLSLKTQLHLK